MKQITIGKENGKYFLIGEDEYCTTQKKYTALKKAEEAKIREQKLLESARQSRMIWNY